MAVQSSFYAADGKLTNFPQTKHIPNKDYVRAYVRLLSDGTWVLYDATKYDVINNSIVFEAPIDPSLYDMIEIRIADSVDELADSISDIAIVAAISANVTTVAGISANVTTVAGISANVTTVANNDANITTVATNIADVITVATDIANVNTAAINIGDISTVAANILDVNTVATDIANVNTTATNIADVNTTATNITDVNTVATNITDVNQVAANIADVNNYGKTYYGSLTADPTTRPDGSTMLSGDLYFNSTVKEMRVYDGAAWKTSTDSYTKTEADGRFTNFRNTISDLSGDTGSNGTVIEILGYHTINDGGGGIFVWDANEDKANHNGVTIFDPDKTFPADWTDQVALAAWFTGDGVGTGCWKRVYKESVNMKWAGAKADYDVVTSTGTDNSKSFQKVFDLFENIIISDGYYLVGEMTIDYGEYTVPTITFKDAKLFYNGAGVMLTVTQSATQAYFDRLTIRGLRVVGTSSAIGCLRLIDCNAPLIENPEIHGFSGAGAFAINMQNYLQWSENHTYLSPKISSCDIGWLIEGASITGGTGTESFARLRILNGFCASGTYWVKNLGGAYDGIIQLRGNMGTSCKAVLYNDSGMGGTVLDGIAVEQGDPTISYIYEHGPNAVNAPAIHVLHYRSTELAGVYNGGEGEGLLEVPTEIQTLGVETTYPTKYISINNYDADTTLASLDHIRPSIHVSGANTGTDAYNSFNNLILAPGAGGKSIYFYTDRFGGDWAARARIDSWGIESYGFIMGATYRSKDYAAATTLGTVIGKQPLYDSAGTLIGYMPVYDTIT